MNFTRALRILKENNLTLVESLDKNIVAKYEQRIKDHIKRVKYFYSLLVESGQIPIKDIDTARVMKHDQDKLKYKNLVRQALRYSPTELTQDEKKQINDVVMEHIKSNPHHCEYWSEGDYASKHIDCTKMSDTYLYEMCADWAATSEELGNPLNKWCDDVLNKKFMFTDRQIDLIRSVCDYLNDYVDPNLKRNYGMKSINLSVLKQ